MSQNHNESRYLVSYIHRERVQGCLEVLGFERSSAMTSGRWKRTSFPPRRMGVMVPSAISWSMVLMETVSAFAKPCLVSRTSGWATDAVVSVGCSVGGGIIFLSLTEFSEDFLHSQPLFVWRFPPVVPFRRVKRDHQIARRRQ